MPEERITIDGQSFVRISRVGVVEDHQTPAVEVDAYYVHTQSLPQAVWEYEHGLGKRPAVRTYGTDEVEIEGDVTYPDDNNVRVEFGGSISGVAYNS